MAENSTSKKSFFNGIKTECKKIIWPTKETTWRQTVAVVGISVVLVAIIRAIDVIAQLVVGFVGTIG